MVIVGVETRCSEENSSVPNCLNDAYSQTIERAETADTAMVVQNRTISSFDTVVADFKFLSQRCSPNCFVLE